MEDLQRRVEALERGNRRWRCAVGLFGGLLLLAVVVAAKTPTQVPDLLQAKRIEVLAPDGEPVITLRAYEYGAALALSCRGDQHERIACLAADKDGAHLRLMKHKEAPLFSATVDDNGSALKLFDGREPSQDPRSIVLRSARPTEDLRGAAGILLMRGTRKSSIEASLAVHEVLGEAFLLLGGAQGKSARLRVNQESGSVEFVDQSNRPVWSTP